MSKPKLSDKAGLAIFFAVLIVVPIVAMYIGCWIQGVKPPPVFRYNEERAKARKQREKERKLKELTDELNRRLARERAIPVRIVED